MKLQRVLLAVFAVALLAMTSGEPQGACCYTHPNYTGTCVVEPAEDETCESILAYLNNPMAQGKSYCGGTKIRGGWKRSACE